MATVTGRRSFCGRHVHTMVVAIKSRDKVMLINRQNGTLIVATRTIDLIQQCSRVLSLCSVCVIFTPMISTDLNGVINGSATEAPF